LSERVRGSGLHGQGRVDLNAEQVPARPQQPSQATLGGIVSAVIGAGLEARRLEEYAEPFWRADGVDAAAWRGRLPNAFSLVARKA
jgi:hypothetical protein